MEVFGFHGSSEETKARPELWRSEGPEWTALGQSGVRTRPFSPTLPVIDRRALFLMASVKVSWGVEGGIKRGVMREKGNERERGDRDRERGEVVRSGEVVRWRGR